MSAYLDHAATTPMRPAAREALIAALDEVGNPASVHAHGQRARGELELAREQIAGTIGSEPVEVVFTSGGTEAINLAIKGSFWSRNRDGARPRILSTAAEHHATLDTLEWLERQGAVIELLPVDARGVVDLAALDQALGDDVALVTMLLANNEVGAMQPVRAATALAHAAGVPVHVDAVGAYGQVPVDRRALGADLLSVAAHKAGGPAGIGALAVDRAAQLDALVHGGGQQRGLRSGTQDVAAARAWAAIAPEITPGEAGLSQLRDRLIEGVRAQVPGATLRGPEPAVVLGDAGNTIPARLPGNAHFTFEGTQGDSLLLLLDMAGVSASAGSACQAGVTSVSHVLLAMGVPEAEARGALRFTLGWSSTEAEVDALLAALPAAAERARRAGLSNRGAA